MYSDYADEMPDENEIERRYVEEITMAEALEKEEALKPKLIFKYKSVSNCTDLKRACDILTECKIYWPKHSELNDPLEGTCSILTNENVYSERDVEREKYRILSFSEDFLLSTLWAHYADNYSGICFGFKRVNTFSDAEKVEYITRAQTTWSNDAELLVSHAFLKKGIEWNYEKEWRLISASDDDFLKFNKDELACVFLGEKMTQFIQDVIRKYIPKGIKVFTVHPDDKRFCLYAKDVDSNEFIYTIDELYKHLKII